MGASDKRKNFHRNEDVTGKGNLCGLLFCCRSALKKMRKEFNQGHTFLTLLFARCIL
jgi:hypothetical protein